MTFDTPELAGNWIAMPYNAATAERVRALMQPRAGCEEKTMFGGVGFLLDGNMCCGVWKEFLILRVGPEVYEACLEQPAVSEFDITGRPMTGWVMVDPDGFDDAPALARWVDMAVGFVATLPKK